MHNGHSHFETVKFSHFIESCSALKKVQCNLLGFIELSRKRSNLSERRWYISPILNKQHTKEENLEDALLQYKHACIKWFLRLALLETSTNEENLLRCIPLEWRSMVLKIVSGRNIRYNQEKGGERISQLCSSNLFYSLV